jgi:hypothetical protein
VEALVMNDVVVTVVDSVPDMVVVAMIEVDVPDIMVATTKTVSVRVTEELDVAEVTVVAAADAAEVAPALFNTPVVVVVDAVVVVVAFGIEVMVVVLKLALRVIRPSLFAEESFSANQILSPGPAAIPQGLLEAVGVSNRYTAPDPRSNFPTCRKFLTVNQTLSNESAVTSVTSSPV